MQILQQALIFANNQVKLPTFQHFIKKKMFFEFREQNKMSSLTLYFFFFFLGPRTQNFASCTPLRAFSSRFVIVHVSAPYNRMGIMVDLKRVIYVRRVRDLRLNCLSFPKQHLLARVILRQIVANVNTGSKIDEIIFGFKVMTVNCDV